MTMSRLTSSGLFYLNWNWWWVVFSLELETD